MYPVPQQSRRGHCCGGLRRLLLSQAPRRGCFHGLRRRRKDQEEQFEAPKLEIDPNVKNFYDFTVDSFKLVDYKCNTKKYKIDVAI